MGLTAVKIEFIESKFQEASKRELELGVYHYFQFTFQDELRCFLVFVPHSLQAKIEDCDAMEGKVESVPVVMLIPGTDESIGSTELRIQSDLDVDTSSRHGEYYSWQEQAQQDGFMLLFVEGSKNAENPKKIRYCFDLGDKDLKYIDEVLKFVQSKYPIIDPNRIYATGFSVGGLFISSLAIYRPHHFAALCNYMGGLMYIPNYMKSDPESVKQLDKTIPKVQDATSKVPLFLITASREDNRSYCMNAKKAFEEHGWELSFKDIEGECHRYIWSQTGPIWEWMKKYSRTKN